MLNCRNVLSVQFVRPVWYSFMSGFMSSFTTSIAKRSALCSALWSASLKTLSHRVKHTVKLQNHSSPLLTKLLMKLFSKKQLYWWSWAVPNRVVVFMKRQYGLHFKKLTNQRMEWEKVYLHSTHVSASTMFIWYISLSYSSNMQRYSYWAYMCSVEY
jgi:hypothetical protein